MDTFNKKQLGSLRPSDSFIIDDSDEEQDVSKYFKNKNATIMRESRVILDSDSESNASKSPESSKDSNDSNSQIDDTVESEIEDLQFLNRSQKVSIVESSSDEDSEEDNNAKFQPPILSEKRKTIYENNINDSVTSSPIQPIQKKKKKRYVISSDSEVEFMDCHNEKRASSFSTPKLSPTLRTTIKSKTPLSKQVDEVVVLSSTSTTDNEPDAEAVVWANKEIGVGNIDPIEAQKKEYLLLKIEDTQQKLDKLEKFTETVSFEKLPDGGAKVLEQIKIQEDKLQSLKIELEKLENKRKTIMEKSLLKNTVEEAISLLDDSSDDNIKAVKKERFRNLISSDEDDSFHDDKNFNDSDAESIPFRNIHTKTQPEESDTKHLNEFKWEDIPKVPVSTFTTDNLGRQALDTLNKQQTLTQQRLQQLHGSLTSCPSEDQKAQDPPGLRISLMPHQQHALAWLQWREKQKPKGGILADDMGLGKTLTMISLIIATNDEKRGAGSDSDESSSDEDWLSKNKKKHKRYYGNTLVVCPASLLKQWEGEVKNRCQRGLLTTRVFHGNNRTVSIKSLSKCDIVITTYQTLVREADGETDFYKLEWKRIILDEAHYVRNHKSKACLSVCGLSGKYRWALTGTPIQNAEMDLYAILKFLKCSPFDDLQVWKRWVENKNAAGKQRLITLMKSLMLRRTKQELSAKGSLQSLPDKNLQIIEIHLDPEEDLVYQKILLFSRNLFAQFLSQRAEKHQMREMNGGYNKLSSYGQNTAFTKAQKALLDHHQNIEAHEILVLLLRLRQMCCHPALIHAMLDKQDAEVNGVADVDLNLQNVMSNMTIHDVDQIEDKQVYDYNLDERVADNLLTKSNPVFENQRKSSKVRSVLKIIKKIINQGDKVIVVSQWTSLLKVVGKFLNDIDDAYYEMFTGEVAVKNRQAIVDKLNDPREDLNILLLSLTAGGVGLNLVGANHLLLVDIHWNPQLEAQAQDRIYRFGQNKNVCIYKFICKDTIEERVKNLQDKKLDVANHVLTGSRTVSKLTIDDLKMLFS